MSLFNYQSSRERDGDSAQDQYQLHEQPELGFISISKFYNDKTNRLVQQQRKMDMVYNYMVKNDIKTEKASDIKEEKVRKTRKDREGRKFICGSCKLGYLSYPALYTHIKTKHDGQTPEGTIRGESTKPKKRGRPKVRKAPQIYQRQIQKSELPKELMNLIYKENLQIFELDNIDIEPNQQEECDIITKYFVEILKQLRKMTSIQPYLLSTSQIITVFLENLKFYLNQETLIKFQQLFIDFINFADEKYLSILNFYQQSTQYYVSWEVKPDQKYCLSERPIYIPVFVEKYVRCKILSDLQQTILADFSRWLFQLKLTDINLMKSGPETIIEK